MNKFPALAVASILLASSPLALVSSSAAAQEKASGDTTPPVPINIGTRRELFVDDFLIEKLSGVELKLHSPTPREIVMVTDSPWEGAGSAYATVFRDGDRFRMYYDACMSINEDGTNIRDIADEWFVCYAESKDGRHWTKPELGIVEFKGSKKNNILMNRDMDPTVFKDPNPACRPGEEYKKIQVKWRVGLFALKSSDGISWSPLGDKPIITKGVFDSQNIAFWDPIRKQYWAYVRGYDNGKRDTLVATSQDFLTWTEPEWLQYGDAPNEQLYTNQVLPYPRAPHIFMGFPTRYVERGWCPSFDSLPDPEHRKNRMKRDKGGSGEPRSGLATTDGLFMTSRDGRTFKRWGEAFIRPGIERKTNWVYGDCFQNWGIVETASDDPFAPPELSFYAFEDQWRHPQHLRRYTLRIDGFVSLHAPHKGGEVLTKPFIFSGKALTLNLSTSAAGNIDIQLLDVENKIPPCKARYIFGDALERVVTWEKGTDISQFAGKPVRLRIEMKDADLFALRFTDTVEKEK